MMAAEIAAGERAVTAAVREAGTGLKLAWRGQIIGAGLGPRLANSIRSEVFPKARASLNAAAVVWSKAPVIVGPHDAGPLIRSRNGLWLAIPTPAAGRALGGRRITPGGWERKTGLRLRFVYHRTGPSLLVADAVRLNTRGIRRRYRPRKPGAARSPRRSSCWYRRSSCRSGSTWRGTPNVLTTRCRR